MSHLLTSVRLPFHPPLIQGFFQKRYKRFLVDVELLDGSIITAHCPNTGAMLGLTNPPSSGGRRKVGLSYSSNPKRIYPYTLEIIEDDGVMVGINTQTPNRLIAHALELKQIPSLAHYTKIEQEVFLPYEVSLTQRTPRTRIDFAVSNPGDKQCFIEVKNVHYKKGSTAYFPDSVTSRGHRHIQNLMECARKGHHCVMIYVIQRSDVTTFDFEASIDPDYAEAAHQAMSQGIDVMAITAHVGWDGIELGAIIPHVI